tara:strand:- start:232 stop:627 length:396 start_codon:yes stop_codon:yes gene_type:complete
MNQDKKNMDVLKYFRELKEGGPAKENVDPKKKKSILSYPLGNKTEQEIRRENPERYKRIVKRTEKYVQRNLDKQQRKNQRTPLKNTKAVKKIKKFTKKVIGNAKINSRNRKAKRSNRGDGQGGGCVNGICT